MIETQNLQRSSTRGKMRKLFGLGKSDDNKDTKDKIAPKLITIQTMPKPIEDRHVKTNAQDQNQPQTGLKSSRKASNSSKKVVIFDSTSPIKATFEALVNPYHKGIDFVQTLPSEIAFQIFVLLDLPSLIRATLTCRDWLNFIQSPDIWRHIFYREKPIGCANELPVKSRKGSRLSKIEPGVDWKAIYRTRHELVQGWKKGRARPVFMQGHRDAVYCLQFDEEKIITGSRDKTIQIWDTHTYKCHIIIGPPSVKDDILTIINNDGTPRHQTLMPSVKEVRTSTPRVLSFPIYHDASILCLKYDDEILVTGSSDYTVIIYDLYSNFQPIRQLRHHEDVILDLSFDKKHIVTASKDRTVCVWDRTMGTLLHDISAHKGPVNSIQLQGNLIVSCSSDASVKLWNIDKFPTPIREFVASTTTKGLACSQISDDSLLVASAGEDKKIQIWSTLTGKCIQEIRAHTSLIRSVFIDSISGRLISGSYDQDINVFEMETGKMRLQFPKWHSSWVLTAKSDYRRIISTGEEGGIVVMDFGSAVKGIEGLERQQEKRRRASYYVS